MQNTIWFLLLMGLKITPLLPYAIPFDGDLTTSYP